MIRSFEINRFKCFKHLEVRDCALVNVIVGDNGVGKTSLLEAIFFALGSSTEIGVRFRQQRGIEGALSGQFRKIEEAIWRDYFFAEDWTEPLSIELRGDGPETRSLKVFRGAPNFSLPVSDVPPLPSPDVAQLEQRTGSVVFVWTDSDGRDHQARPVISRNRVEFPSTDEEVPDFFYYSAGTTPNATEVATRFSELRREGGLELLQSAFVSAFPWLTDIQIEVLAGAPVLYGTDSRGIRLPLALISGALNRLAAILLSIASRTDAVVLVDELEDGIFYQRHVAMWRAVLAFATRYNTQIFTTTHSKEWLDALVAASDDEYLDAISLWRIERENGSPVIFQFSGDELKDGIEYGAEVRGEIVR